jgi:hypothetical protein
MFRQLLKEENTKDNCAGVTKVIKQLKKLSNVNRSQNASEVTSHRRLPIQRLRNVTEPLTKSRKEGTTFRRVEKQVHMSGELEGPEIAYSNLKKPPETEIVAMVCTPGMMPSTEDKRAQTELIGSHSEEHPPKGSPHKTTTQVNHDYNPQKDNKGTVKHDSTMEGYNLEAKHPSRIENHATSPFERSDHKEKRWDGTAISVTIRKKHTGKVANMLHHHPLTTEVWKWLKPLEHQSGTVGSPWHKSSQKSKDSRRQSARTEATTIQKNHSYRHWPWGSISAGTHVSSWNWPRV